RLADPRTVVGPRQTPHFGAALDDPGTAERYGAPYLTSSRLGQGAFHLSVLDAYKNRCAVTGERVRPVLEAAHIKPFSLEGPNVIPNGLGLRAAIHKLFDRGYVSADRGLRFRVSSRLTTEFDNGFDYYKHQNAELVVVPDRELERPAREFLEWHNDVVFRP